MNNYSPEVSGTALPAQAASLCVPESRFPVHAWRVMEWQPESAFSAEQAACFSDILPDVFSLAGRCFHVFSSGRDRCFILLAHTTYAAPVHCDLTAWLCAHTLIERCHQEFNGEGTLRISSTFTDPECWEKQDCIPMSDWWNTVSPITPSEAHHYRDLLHAYIRRRRFNHAAGCVRGILTGRQDPGMFCAAFVPVAAEAIWHQYPGIPVSRLTEDLSMDLLTHRPEEALTSWLSSCSGLLEDAPSATPAHDIEDVRKVILQNPALPYTQERMAHSLGLSPTYFCRLFHEQTGETFSVFLTSARMQLARKLLKEDRYSLQEVAEMCGYPNKSYFCKVFHKYVHLSPGAYVSQQQAASDSRSS